MKSKKRSAASYAPPDPVFFIDQSLVNKKVPEALRQAGLTVIAHTDRFRPDAQDVEWLTVAGAEGWVVITKDSRIRYRQAEREVLIRSGVRAFVLSAGNLTAEQMAESLTAAIPKMLRTVSRIRPPFIASVGRGGSVQLKVPGSSQK